MDAIIARRSVRNFTNQSVSEEQLTQLLKAAMAAPSAGNEQPWEFIVVHDRGALEEITQVHQYSQMLKEAPVAIVVCADPRRGKYPFEYWIQDCAAATENILIAAVTAGLGACWLGIYPQPERVIALRRIFSVPEPIIPFSVVAIGYSVKKMRPSDRFDATRIHQENW